MIEELLSELPIVQNWGFILFLLFFFISIWFLRKEKLLSFMLESLFRRKERQSKFFTLVHNELGVKLLLCLQTVVLSSISIYYTFHYFTGFSIDSANQLFLFLATVSLAVLIYFLYKFLMSTLIGNVFFQKEQVQLWNESFFSIISLSGLVLLIPTLLLFFLPQTFLFCFSFLVLYFLFVVALMTYKVYTIFFARKSLLLYFILYLCAQEILPLYFLYKVLVYLFNTMQTGILWVQE